MFSWWFVFVAMVVRLTVDRRATFAKVLCYLRRQRVIVGYRRDGARRMAIVNAPGEGVYTVQFAPFGE